MTYACQSKAINKPKLLGGVRLLKKVGICILLVSIMCACSQQESKNKTSLLEQAGIIAIVDNTAVSTAESHSILLIPDIEGSRLANKIEDELIRLAQENQGAYYGVNPEMYEELQLETGMKVKVYWNGDQGDSDPPVREAEEIKVIIE